MDKVHYGRKKITHIEPTMATDVGGAPITVYQLGHLFPNYNVLIGNFDNYSSNLIVSDE